jgi:hypothetical protein
MIDIVTPRREHERERGRCAFCDYRGKLTREHVWPERFNKIVKVTGLAEHQRGGMGSVPAET